MLKRRLLINSLLSVAQVVVNGGALFLLYRYLNQAIGKESFGVWALVLATTSASGIANLGLGATAVKFVSQYLARDDEARVRAIIQTASVTIGIVLTVVLSGLYVGLQPVLRFLIEPVAQEPVAIALLPYALASFWLTAQANVFLSSIDGFQRVDLRNLIYMTFSVVYLVLAVYLVDRQGLIGLARAQTLQSGLLCLSAWFTLRRLLPSLPWVPFHWNRPVFREMLAYGVNFQVVSVARLLFDPTTRMLVAKFGGLANVTHYEYAYRMVVQLRSLIVTANQAVVPTIANLQEKQPEVVSGLYRTSMRLLLFLIAALLPFFVGITPLISELWLGAYEATFIFYANLLFAGWFTNVLSGPSYYANLGTGELRWNVWSHVAMGLLNAGLGVTLGLAFGGTGVVIGTVASIMTGSLLLILAYQRSYGITTAELIDRPSLFLGTAALASLALMLLLYYRLRPTWAPLPLALLMLGAYAVVMGIPLYTHPMRDRLTGWLLSLRPSRS